MSSSSAASLSTSLLTTKGNAQPSRGLAQPMIERSVVAGLEAGAAIRAINVAKPAVPKPPVRAKRVLIRMDDRQRLRLALASVHLGKSRQTVVLDAIEHYLSRAMPTLLSGPCACISGDKAEKDRGTRVEP